jgi:hypothetical protein
MQYHQQYPHQQSTPQQKTRRRTAVFVGLAVLAVVGGASPLISNATRYYAPSGREPLTSRVEEPLPRRSALRLPFAKKELVGRYYLGDGLGVNCSLTLEANRRFKFTWHGCVGEYDRNQGRWEIEGDSLVMKPERPNKREGFQGMNLRFVPVKWGRRIYLVDENEMPGFCATARHAQSPSRLDGIHGNDYVKWNGEKLPPLKGKPTLPERYLEYYEKGPVAAMVIKIEPDGRVLLNKGSADRLRPGMLLDLVGFSGRIEVKVTSVRPNEATARVSYFWNSARKVKVGDAFTTGEDWHRVSGTGFARFRQPPHAPANERSRER